MSQSDAELWQKRAEAWRKLDEYVGWHWSKSDATSIQAMMLKTSLAQEILVGTAEQVDYLAANFDKHNQIAMLKRLARA